MLACAYYLGQMSVSVGRGGEPPGRIIAAGVDIVGGGAVGAGMASSGSPRSNDRAVKPVKPPPTMPTGKTLQTPAAAPAAPTVTPATEAAAFPGLP